jgi:hypothetical protein
VTGIEKGGMLRVRGSNVIAGDCHFDVRGAVRLCKKLGNSEIAVLRKINR